MYTCAEYREEMLLLSLRKQLNREGLSEKQKQKTRITNGNGLKKCLFTNRKA